FYGSHCPRIKAHQMSLCMPMPAGRDGRRPGRSAPRSMGWRRGSGPPRVLSELAGDKSLADALHITPEEWKALRSIELPATLAKPPIAWRRHRPEQ
ncbi:MAG: hypothetical protein LC131_12030, partial [Anaerolineae bacterium]|nr:hypothetical protein [Anaerolineae bacterium]